jgi:hypothetical protein
MKFLRYGDAGSEKPDLVDADGIILDLSGFVGKCLKCAQRAFDLALGAYSHRPEPGYGISR